MAVADVGIHDVLTASVKWSDGQTTSSQAFVNIDNTCGPGAGRSVIVDRRLAAGESIYPVEVRVADDDHSPATGTDDMASFKMSRLDLALNDDDDNNRANPISQSIPSTKKTTYER